jgi:exodeoxyribonuclease V beta subunit
MAARDIRAGRTAPPRRSVPPSAEDKAGDYGSLPLFRELPVEAIALPATEEKDNQAGPISPQAPTESAAQPSPLAPAAERDNRAEATSPLAPIERVAQASPLAPASGARGRGEGVGVAAIDLQRHAVIGASAGTGKTYSLEHLVLRLLTEADATLEQILLVTFTEKAAGELKDRLRMRLEKALPEMPAHQAVIQTALDSFDQAHVYTIHGFCQRTLQEYAFEQRQDFRQELALDVDLLQSCLREIQRKAWREEYGEQLRTVLELADYNGIKGSEAWEQRVLRIAGSLRQGCDHRLQPDLLDGWPGCLQELGAGLRADWETCRRLAGPLDANRLEEHPLYVGFDRLDVQANWRDPRRRKVLLPLLRWLADPEAGERPVIAFCRLLITCAEASSFNKHAFRLISTQLSKKAVAQLADYCPGLMELVELVEQRRQATDWDALQHQLALGTIRQLHEHLTAYKRERGLLSFEDMLTRVDDALNPGKNPEAEAVATHLRRRYRYAVIDEFQDTDLIQWRIFKRIFVDGGPPHRLFVVGDPKQAIFGFRGADLQAYLSAVRDLSDGHAAQEVHLDVNWRSCPELLDQLNVLFANGEWFAGTDISYRPVLPPRETKPPSALVADRTGQNALTLVDLAGLDSARDARRHYAQFIAHEIGRLLGWPGGNPLLEFEAKGKPARGLRADDICVLVFKRREAIPLLDALRAAKIPYSFYKQPGLWQSEEAVHLSYVLKALARPDQAQGFRKALLTRFFRLTPQDLSQSDELPANHPTKELFARWLGWADDQNWAPLFQSLLEDTGLLHDDPQAAEAERRLANCRHIFHALQHAAYAENLDLLGILDRLETLRRRPSDNDMDVQPIETEQRKVQIMTIHASKGLEFPVVFLAGGFTGGRGGDYLTYRDGNTLVFDLRKGDDARSSAAKQEQDAEQRRLLYVALTRPMFKLYVPKLAADCKYQSKGPVITILAPAAEKAGLRTTEARLDRPAEVQPRPEEVSAPPSPEPPVCDNLAKLLPPADLDFRRRRILIRSFSSLHRQSSRSEVPNFAERLPRADDDDQDALAGQEPLRGPVFGDLVHDVLEKIDFAAVGRAEAWQALLTDGTPARQLVDQQLAKHLPRYTSRLSLTQLQEPSRQQVARLVWNALHTPLSALGGPLWQIPAGDRLHELEFHFPEMEDAPPEVRRENGFLTGFMDLVFRHNGKVFLADWKTNLLSGSYTPDELAHSMRECDYVRQYRLYLQALARWQKRARGDAFDPRRDLGGVYYLYVRGMNGQDEAAGVFFHRPTADDLRLEQVLAD